MAAPEHRFKNFCTPWKFVRLKDAADFFDYGVNTASAEFDGLHRYIRITDIDERSGKYVPCTLQSPGEIPQDSYLVRPDDILFARTGTSVGKAYLYDTSDGVLYFAGFLIRMHVNCGYNSRFILNQTFTPRYKKWVAVTSMRSGQPGINLQEYGQYGFYAPQKAEQDKIAACISLIDRKIELQQRRTELLKDCKKGLLQTLFPEEGRVSGAKWKKVRIEDILEERSRRGVLKHELLSVMKHGGVKKRSELDAMDISSEDKHRYKLVMPGDMVCNSMRMWQGACGISRYRGIVSPAYTVLKPKAAVSALWLGYLFKTESMVKNFKRHSQGLTNDTWNLKYPQMAKIQLWLPPLREQEQTARLLFKTDEKIKIQKEKTKRLRIYKQTLLRKILL